MKFVHLSDLHLGKRVNEFSMLEDQKYILDQIYGIISEERADGVIIAGDVYDKPIPPAEAVQLFDRFLTRLASLTVPVFIISGNHDSAQRLSFGSELMKGQNVYIAREYEGSVQKYELEDKWGKVCVYLLPFLKPAYVKRYFPDENTDTYDSAVRLVLENTQVDGSVRNVLAAHQFITGAGRSDSEEVSVGGIDNIDASAFEAFDYVALGHIHRPQSVGRETLRYCGTPLKYSFSEAGHLKSVTIVELLEKGHVEISTRNLRPLHDMRRIKGTYEEITDRKRYRDTAVDDYLHITLTDEEEILDAVGKLRSIYPNIMRLDYDNKRTRQAQSVQMTEAPETKTPVQLFEELYELQNNQEMSEGQRVYLEEVIEEIWEGEK